MKFLDRFEQLVLEVADLKRDNERLRVDLRDANEKLGDRNAALEDDRREIRELAADRAHYMSECDKLRIENNFLRINPTSPPGATPIPSDQWEALANSMIANDDDMVVQRSEYGNHCSWTNKIQRVKEFRVAAGCGLKEAKDAIEAAALRKCGVKRYDNP